MRIQHTREKIVKALLIGTVTLTTGTFNLQPATAQFNRSTFRETSRELNLSRSQMREVAGILRSFNSEIKDILTPEQFEELKSAKEQQQSNPQGHNLQNLHEELNLTDTQSADLFKARKVMTLELQEVLAPEQIEKIMENVAFK